jgi:hypothetical protein
VETTHDNFARNLRDALATRTSPPPPKLRSRRYVLTLLLGVWGGLGLATSATLLAVHEYALPAPSPTDPQLGLAMAALHAEAPTAQATALHVLYVQCRCSQRILEHLVERKALPLVHETVALVDSEQATDTDHIASKLSASGFEVQRLTPASLKERYSSIAAPLLVVANGQDKLTYIGGYAEHKQSLDMRDVKIIDAARMGQDIDALPVLGCAVSASLQKLMDPLGLKYPPQENP